MNEEADRESIVCELESAMSAVELGDYASALTFAKRALALIEEKAT